MDMIPLQASTREKTPKAKLLRRQGSVPCILYGFETKNTAIACKEISLKKAYEKAGESTIIELDIGSKKIPVLFYDIHFDPVNDHITHADFFAVNMKEEVETEVPIQFTGIPPAIASHDAILVTTMDHVTVKCLPGNLPHSLPVSLDNLQEINDALYVRDIALPNDVRILDNPEIVIALMQEKREEEKEEPKPAEGEVPVEGEKTVEDEKKKGEAEKTNDIGKSDKKKE